MQLQFLHEDNHLIAVNKPPGYLVQGDESGDIPLTEYVKDYIKVRYNKPGDVFLGVIHRLDRPTSGVVIFARTSKGLSRMNELFKNREVEKEYWAVTQTRPDPLEGELVHYIAKDRDRNVSKAFSSLSNRAKAVQAKRAVLQYRLQAELNNRCLISVNLHTGRSHQIRVQLSSIGCPIVGDLKYGYPKANQDGSIYLHCRKISFVHPVKKEQVEISADPPNDPTWKLF